MTEGNTPTGILKIYQQAVKNVGILKYSWVLIGTICILALAAYFKLKNSDVFLYALGVIAISFLAFVFSLLIKTKDVFLKVLLYILISSIVVVCSSAVLAFGSFIFWQKPDFYKRWFPDQTKNFTDTIPSRRDTVFIAPIKDTVPKPKYKSQKIAIEIVSLENRRNCSSGPGEFYYTFKVNDEIIDKVDRDNFMEIAQGDVFKINKTKTIKRLNKHGEHYELDFHISERDKDDPDDQLEKVEKIYYNDNGWEDGVKLVTIVGGNDNCEVKLKYKITLLP